MIVGADGGFDTCRFQSISLYAGAAVRVGADARPRAIAAVPGAQGELVIGPSGNVRVMVATKPVDFRKGAERLAALVRETMRVDPFSGVVSAASISLARGRITTPSAGAWRSFHGGRQFPLLPGLLPSLLPSDRQI